jgi:copper transport protein
VLLSGLFLGAELANAHAVLLESNPTSELVLDVAPTEIRLGFNENVSPIFVKVLDATGAEVGAAGEFRVQSNDVYLPLGEELENGTYVAVYRVISADTHPVGGSVLFAVGEAIADVGSVADSSTAASGWQLPVAMNRFLLYVAGALSAGSALLLLLMNLPAGIVAVVKTQGERTSLLTAMTLLLAIGLGGSEMLAGGVTALFSIGAWSTGLASTLGSSALLGIPGAALLWLTFRQSEAGTPKLMIGTILVLGSFLVTGHAATAPPAWVMAFVVGIHLFAGAFWFAALHPLAHAAKMLEPVAAGQLLEHFSARAIWVVALLVLSGVVVSWVQVQGISAFVTTDYGIRLLIKIGLVLVVIGLALLNKQKLTSRVMAAEQGAADALRRSIRGEYILMLLIMAVTVSLTLPSPPRALAAMGGSPIGSSSGFTSELTKDEFIVELEVSPARTGENMIMLKFIGADGKPLEMQSVRILLALPVASLDGVEREGEAMTPGMYHFMVNDLIIPGDWELRIDAFVDDFDKRIIRTTVPIN